MLKNVYKKDGKTLVSRVKASLDLKGSIKKSLDLIGGLEKVVSSGDKVLVKPNFNSDDPFPASSDPEFVKATVSLLHEAGASQVVIIESSGMPWLPTRRVLDKTGMLKAAKECGAEVRVLDDRGWVDVKIEGNRWKKVSIAKDILEEKAKFVWLLLDFRQRNDLHSAHLEEKVAELNLVVHPDLIIMDGRKCFVTGGPDVGRVEEPNVTLASGDRIAIDVEALKILKSYKVNNRLDMNSWKFLQIKHAVELGLGVKGEDEILIISE